MSKKKKKVVKRKNNGSKKNTTKKKKTNVAKNSQTKKASSTPKKETKKKIEKIVEPTFEHQKKEVLVKEDKPSETKELVVEELPEEVLKEKSNKKLIIRLLCLIILVILILALVLKPKQNTEVKFNTINIEEYLEWYKKDSLEYIFITDDDCISCDNARLSIEKLKNDYSLTVNELNIHNLDEYDIIKLKESNSSLKDNINVPIMLSIKNGKEIGKIDVRKEYSALKRFVEYSSNPLAVNSFNKINVNKYLSLLKSNDLTVIYIGSPTNEGCKEFSTILESVSQELNFKVNYLDTDTITKAEDWELLNKSDKIFNKDWFVPTILIIKKGNIVGYKMESMEKSMLVDFFDRYGL